MVDFGGNITTYAYAWDATTATNGLGTFGGWTKTTVNAANKTATNKTDYFGRTVSRVDYGAHSYTYNFNKAGLLTSQTNSAGQNISYVWLNTGKLAKSTDGAGNVGYFTSNVIASYGYDVDGNRTYEKYFATVYQYDYLTGAYTTTTMSTDQDATVTYDALNRMVSFLDVAQGSGKHITVNYEYDAGGNVRHVLATYPTIATSNTPSTTKTQNYWYRYDSMNRFVTVKGELWGVAGATGTTIVRGLQGTDIEYDQAHLDAALGEEFLHVTEAEGERK